MRSRGSFDSLITRYIGDVQRKIWNRESELCLMYKFDSFEFPPHSGQTTCDVAAEAVSLHKMHSYSGFSDASSGTA